VPDRQALQGAVWSGTALERIVALLGGDRDALEAAALNADSDIELLGLDGEPGAPLTLAGIGREASPGAAYRAALEAVGRAGADVLARMAAIAGPARRLVVTGGWATGAAAQAVKARHLGPFDLSPGISQGARGAALAAGRAAGIWDNELQEVT
jgi:sugar (pentulose or hexulose) kinase